jgi:alginate O-acetyltransferase complex protein AlgI
MLFNSLQYLIFFPVVVGLFFSIPHRFRWVLLLGASYYFYMCWKPEYVLLIIASTLIDYYAGIRMGKIAQKKKRKIYLILSLVTNIGLLFSFKYFNFFNDSARSFFDGINIFYGVPALDILLPIGISFYTFQTLSYSIDVYRGTRKPETHVGIFAVYVSFFPQLVAGPIERSTRLLPQFHKVKHFDYQRMADGVKLMLWGFFKKVVIADRLAIYVNEVYNNPGDFSGAPLILASYFFAFQIYCDFSGYSDIAIGSARVMGYDLMTNFRRPYFSKSISEFWKRWHISLSSWFRDYLYIPLGGSRVTVRRWHVNILAVFLISGLWHGANWTFLIWGGLHGSYLLFSRMTRKIRGSVASFFKLNHKPQLQKLIRVFITFHLVLFAWIFFRANTLSDALLIIQKIPAIDFSNIVRDLASGFHAEYIILGWTDLLVSFLVLAFLETVELIQRRGSFRLYIASKPLWLRWSAYYGLIVSIVLFGIFKHAEFIYFQF